MDNSINKLEQINKPEVFNIHPLISHSSRRLVDITLNEAIEVMKLGERFDENVRYQLRTKENPWGEKFAQLFYVWRDKEHISVNFSDWENAVHLCQGNECYRTHYRIIKYLERKGFDLESADANER